MSKAARNRELSARARIAEQQAAMHKAQQRRRLFLVGGSTLLVIVVVVAIIVGGSLFSNSPKQAGSSGLPQSFAHNVTNVPASALAKVGTGALPAVTSLPVRTISDPTLTSAGGKPEFLYIGAEFCPYCAAMRWSMAVALSKFGTFGPLKGIHSSSTDVYPNTATLTFYKQQYTSKYLTFTPVENEDVAEKPLQATTKDQQAVWVKYDSQGGGTGFPFLYFGGKIIMTGPLYNPAVLKGLNWSQIAAQLDNPSSPVAQNINGAANYITASICKMTSDSPSTVCKTGAIPSIESKL